MIIEVFIIDANLGVEGSNTLWVNFIRYLKGFFEVGDSGFKMRLPISTQDIARSIFFPPLGAKFLNSVLEWKRSKIRSLFLQIQLWEISWKCIYKKK